MEYEERLYAAGERLAQRGQCPRSEDRHRRLFTDHLLQSRTHHLTRMRDFGHLANPRWGEIPRG